MKLIQRFYQVLHLIEFTWYFRHILDGQARLAKSDVAKNYQSTDLIIFLQPSGMKIYIKYWADVCEEYAMDKRTALWQLHYPTIIQL